MILIRRLNSFSILALICLAAIPSVSQVPPGVKEPTYFSYAFNSKAKELKSFLDSARYVEFLNFYNENYNELNKKAPAYDYWYYLVANHLNSNFDTEISSLIQQAMAITSDSEFPEQKWAYAINLYKKMNELNSNYDSFYLLRYKNFRSSKIEISRQMMITLEKYFKDHIENGFNQFVNHPLSRTFCGSYPLLEGIMDEKFYQDHSDIILQHSKTINSLSEDEFFVNAKSGMSLDLLDKYIENIYKIENAEFSWGNFIKLIQYFKTQSLSEKFINGFYQKYVSIFIVNDNGDSANKDLDVLLANIKPIHVQPNSQDIFKAIKDEQHKYKIVISNFVQKSDRKILSKNDIESKFQTGFHFEPNEGYDSAQIAVDTARQNYNTALSLYTNAQATNSNAGNGYAALGNALNGAAYAIALGQAQRQLNEALNNLRNTPRQTRVEDFQDYLFSTTNVNVSKVVNYSLYCFQTESSLVIGKQFDYNKSNTFALVYNLNSKDPHINSIKSNYQNESSVDNFEKEPWLINESEIISLASQGEAHQISANQFENELSASLNKLNSYHSSINSPKATTTTPDQRFNSVVIVLNPKGQLGTGFYISDKTIITNQHVVEGSDYPEIKLFSGETLVGKVIKIDLGLDLALVKVSRGGKALELFEDDIEPGLSVDAIGHPKGLTFSLTRGIVSAIRYIPNPFMAGSRKMLVIQTDAAINPGNSGGPLLIGTRVIGINSQKLSGNGVEGLGFALHFSEVKQFLNSAK